MRDSLDKAADWSEWDFQPSLRPWQEIREVTQGLARRTHKLAHQRWRVAEYLAIRGAFAAKTPPAR
jgi:hypothetical protein